MMERFIYKVCERSAWEKAVEMGHFVGSSDDVRDGYVHLSTADQLVGTLSKHFAGQTDLVLITFPTDSLAAALRWEPTTSGRIYPHFYGPLPTARATRIAAIGLDANKRHILPEGYEEC